MEHPPARARIRAPARRPNPRCSIFSSARYTPSIARWVCVYGSEKGPPPWAISVFSPSGSLEEMEVVRKKSHLVDIRQIVRLPAFLFLPSLATISAKLSQSKKNRAAIPIRGMG